jgi:hypothetical protein
MAKMKIDIRNITRETAVVITYYETYVRRQIDPSNMLRRTIGL